MLAVVCTATFFLLWVAFMLFRFLRLPAYLEAFAALLLVAEFVAVLVTKYQEAGSVLYATATTVAGRDVPALGLLLYAISFAYARRAWRAVTTARLTTRSR